MDCHRSLSSVASLQAYVVFKISAYNLKYLEIFFTPDVEYESGVTVLFVILGAIEALVVICEALSVIFLSITLGSITFKRRRFLGMLAFYTVISTLQNAIIGFGEYFMLYETSGDAFFVILTVIMVIVVTAAMAIGAYFLNAHLLKNKFNIE